MDDFDGGITAHDRAARAPFFVVSPGKLAVMSFFTFGMYWLYCVYQNWKQHKARTGERIRPFWRCFFAMFFFYPLLRRVNDCIRESGKTYDWSILVLTLVFYVLGIGGLVADVALESWPWAILAVSFMVQVGGLFLLIAVQKGINFSAGDVSGQANSRLTLVNWLWLLPGIALQLITLFTMVALFA